MTRKSLGRFRLKAGTTTRYVGSQYPPEFVLWRT
jgi:hypothetical protein